MPQADKSMCLAACFGEETTITGRLDPPRSSVSKVTELKNSS
jgi:hypothetical protein